MPPNAMPPGINRHGEIVRDGQPAAPQAPPPVPPRAAPPAPQQQGGTDAFTIIIVVGAILAGLAWLLPIH